MSRPASEKAAGRRFARQCVAWKNRGYPPAVSYPADVGKSDCEYCTFVSNARICVWFRRRIGDL